MDPASDPSVSCLFVPLSSISIEKPTVAVETPSFNELTLHETAIFRP
jgi:hypothetical protein